MLLTGMQLLHQNEDFLKICQQLLPVQVLHQLEIVLQRFTVIIPQAHHQH